MTTRTSLTLALVLAAAAAAPAAAQDRILASARPPATACPAGGPLQVWLLQQSSATDCDNTVSGTTDALCCCNNGSWGACATSSGGAGTVTDVALAVPAEWTVSGSPVTSSGTITISEATQSANRVYAGPTVGSAAAPGFRALVSADIPNNAADTSGTAATATNALGVSGFTATKCARFDGSGVLVAASGDCSAGDTDVDTKVIFDIGDDGGNDSTGLTEISTLHDDYGVLTEPSADEAQIDLGKVPPYQQYDPMRPPSTCAQCDEFTGSVTFSFAWQNQESSTATAEHDGLTISHPADATGIAAYWLTGPDGSTTDWAMHTRISTAHAGGTNEAGLILLATGTEGTPTLMYMVMMFASSSTTSTVGVRSMTSYTSAQTLVGTDFNGGRAGFIGIGYVSSTKRLSFYFSEDGYNFRALAGVTLGAHPKTPMGLMTASLSASLPSSGHFNFLRIRTDAGRLEVGE